MYVEYTRQVVPSASYRELLGTAICVFNSNNSFIIENVIKSDEAKTYIWHELIDLTSGDLHKQIKETITKKSNKTIAALFGDIVAIRNRIAHSFQVTAPDGLSDDVDKQLLATKYKGGRQEYITSEFLLKFIKKNEDLSLKLHEFRGY